MGTFCFIHEFFRNLLTRFKLTIDESDEFIYKTHLKFSKISVFIFLNVGVYFGDGMPKDRIKLVFH